MDDRDGTITTPTPEPDTEDTGGQGNVTVTHNDVSTDELDEFRRWKANRDSTSQTPWPVPNVNEVDEPEAEPTEEAVKDEGPSMEERLAQLEHTVSRIPTSVLLSRSPSTNPVDDPDDPPMNVDPDFPNDVNRRTRGDWGGHPWSVLVKDRESETVA